ncbi:MAG: spore coat protein CotJB [Turicibacter sp.]|nr:spore coat protein CotJB [Turicibacter sp.]
MTTHQKQLLDQISATSLIAHDIHLFLDTHPGNEEALRDHKKVSEQVQKLQKQYEENYGPLLNFGHQTIESQNNWIQGPWPWQNK